MTDKPMTLLQELDADIELASKQLSELCQTGGRSWCLHIPVQHDDPDVVYGRMISHAQRFRAFADKLEGEEMRQAFERVMVDGYDFTCDSSASDSMYIKPDTFEAYEGFKAALAVVKEMVEK